jgi:hypothetical protein
MSGKREGAVGAVFCGGKPVAFEVALGAVAKVCNGESAAIFLGSFGLADRLTDSFWEMHFC